MKRNILLSLLFVMAFAITYLTLCYMVPGWRIKLDAEPFVYFIESLKSMVFIKATISLVVGIVLTFLVGKVTGGKR